MGHPDAARSRRRRAGLTQAGLLSRHVQRVQTNYRTRAIISRSLLMFYPLFHCGLQCRAVNISWFLFKDTIHVATKNWMDVFPRKRIGFANLALVSNSILTQLELQKGFGPIVLEFDDRHVCVKKSQQQWTKVEFAWIWATFSHVYP